jgi:DNA invertase Pin-like site-specific DNA recombinase
MKIGYMRVSTFDQNLDMQEDALKRDGCDKIFSDKVSGASSKIERPGLSGALDYMREGDTLVIYKLDRLGRTLKGLIQMINELGDKKMGLKSLSESIDTTTANGKLIFHIFGAISEFERDIIRERTRAGLGAARARGRVGGRPTKMTPEKTKMAKQLHADTSLEIKDIVKTLGVSRAVFYRMLKE